MVYKIRLVLARNLIILRWEIIKIKAQLAKPFPITSCWLLLPCSGTGQVVKGLRDFRKAQNNTEA